MISLALLALFVVVTFALWREGLWSSAIMFLNVLAAATFATAWFEWAVALLQPRLKSYDYLLDLICIWGLFALILLTLREVSDRVSRTKVKFRKPVEMFGCPVVAAATSGTTQANRVTRAIAEQMPSTRAATASGLTGR